ncbi:hypothetical protein PFISCL1PPCAC_21668 [Pristionchus fissidentatus]|uniref:Uncharacterized protein n=1 Tax=Pristionchus fissidentatus TaxID=1538716 RepID=A0AAV5WEM7_9BILA|nr:hypothetical protein PFISCL1PPCAC_21668 [Pristionchus fissidentatus]
MKSIIALFLLPLIVNAIPPWTNFGEVDISGRVVCKAHNGSFVPVKGVEVSLETPEIFGKTLGVVITDKDGNYRLNGGKDQFKYTFFKLYPFPCHDLAIRSICPYVDEKCGGSTVKCHYTRAVYDIPRHCYYSPPHQEKKRCFDGDVILDQKPMHEYFGNGCNYNLYEFY